MNVALPRWFDCIATALSLGLLFGAVGFVVHAALPAESWQAPTVNLEAGPDATPQKRNTLGLIDLAVIWQRDLRQPVVDPPPAKPRPEKKERQLAIELLGTAVEADRQYGVFRLSDKRTVVRAVGEEVEGLEIIQISRGQARLRNGQREYELSVPWLERITADAGDQGDG